MPRVSRFLPTVIQSVIKTLTRTCEGNIIADELARDATNLDAEYICHFYGIPNLNWCHAIQAGSAELEKRTNVPAYEFNLACTQDELSPLSNRIETLENGCSQIWALQNLAPML